MIEYKPGLIKIPVIFSVFILFLSGTTGLFEINIGKDLSFQFSSHLFSSSDNLQLIGKQIILTREFIGLLISGLILTVALPILPPLKAAGLTLIILFILFLIGYFNRQPSLITIEFSLLSIVVIYIVNILMSYFIEMNAKQRLIDTFGQYVPPQIADELSRRSNQVSLEGEAKTLTVFFCDLENFTGIAEQLNPKQLSRLLNEYFTVMTEILFKHGGTIDKYIGDAIMAFWNAPIEHPCHQKNAVEAALEMNTAIKQLANTFITRGWPGPTLGIGINTGRANVGNIGSKYRMAYTAIGDEVNLAARLESLTRKYRVPIIISEKTRSKLPGISCRELDRVKVRGKNKPTRIFQPICRDDEVDNRLKKKLILHAQAVNLHNEKKYNNAMRLFKQLYEQDKSDKFYKAMIKIILEKIQTGSD